MNNIWSNSKYINMIINCLLFLVGINFLHYGQLLLPIICLILFIDNKLQFKVNRPSIFVLLCLFGISFYAFSYQLGFYSVMGFTLPMAYYIGSNIRKPDETKVKNIILLLAFAMSSHLILNSIYEYIVHGKDGFFFSSSHFDIWLGQKVSSTLIAIDIVLLVACLYYLLFHEKNLKTRYIGIVMFIISIFYLIVIGRRTPLLILIIVMFLSFFYETFIIKTIDNKHKKQFIAVSVCLLVLIVLFLLLYHFNAFRLQILLEDFRIIQKLKLGLLNDQRVTLLVDTIKLLPKYLFGGQKISSELGVQVHHFWLDIYDYAGIVPTILILIYSFFFMMVFINILKDKNRSNSFKVLVLGLITCIFILFNVEPMMTGNSLFVIISVFIGALLERLQNE